MIDNRVQLRNREEAKTVFPKQIILGRSAIVQCSTSKDVPYFIKMNKVKLNGKLIKQDQWVALTRDNTKIIENKIFTSLEILVPYPVGNSGVIIELDNSTRFQISDTEFSELVKCISINNEFAKVIQTKYGYQLTGNFVLDVDDDFNPKIIVIDEESIPVKFGGNEDVVTDNKLKVGKCYYTAENDLAIFLGKYPVPQMYSKGGEKVTYRNADHAKWAIKNMFMLIESYYVSQFGVSRLPYFAIKPYSNLRVYDIKSDFALTREECNECALSTISGIVMPYDIENVVLQELDDEGKVVKEKVPTKKLIAEYFGIESGDHYSHLRIKAAPKNVKLIYRLGDLEIEIKNPPNAPSSNKELVDSYKYEDFNNTGVTEDYFKDTQLKPIKF